MAIQKASAIVLKTQPFRSSSLIVTFFTKEFGKLRGLAKGVKQEREIRGADFELFNGLEIVFYEKMRSDLHLVSETAITATYEALRSRLEALTYASYFSELTDQLTEVHDPHPKIFGLLDFCFRYLASLPGPRLARLFEIKLLSEIGWLPYLDRCLNCEKTGLEKGYFSSRQGALFCEACRAVYPDAQFLAAEPLAVMRYYIKHDLEPSIKLGMAKATETALEAFMTRFFNERLIHPLKTRRFLAQVCSAF